MNNKLYGVALVVLTLTGCASDEPKTPAQVALSDLPGWYLKPPSEDGIFYSSGMSVSNDLQFAMDQAVLTAKVTLADRITSKLNAITKVHKAQHGVGVSSSAEKTIKNIIHDADITGYEIIDCVITPLGNSYRAYVLMKYVPTKDTDAAKAFDELDKLDKATPAAPAPNLQAEEQADESEASAEPEPPPPVAAPRQKVRAFPL